MKDWKLLLSLCWIGVSASVCAQSEAPQPKQFELVVDATINGKAHTLRSTLYESLRGQMVLETGSESRPQTYKVQSYLMRKPSPAKTGATHVLHVQVFQRDAGRWVLVSEPTLDVREDPPASMALEGGAEPSPLRIALRALPSS